MVKVLRRPSRGQALIEFAISIPILLTVVMAMINCAWFLFQQQSVTNAARTAAREAAVLNPLLQSGTGTSCTSGYGEPTSTAASPATTVELAASKASTIVPINTSALCATGATSASMTSSTTQSGTATVTITGSPTLASPNTVTATVTYTTPPLDPFWPISSLTISASATDTPQSSG